MPLLAIAACDGFKHMCRAAQAFITDMSAHVQVDNAIYGLHQAKLNHRAPFTRLYPLFAEACSFWVPDSTGLPAAQVVSVEGQRFVLCIGCVRTE